MPDFKKIGPAIWWAYWIVVVLGYAACGPMASEIAEQQARENALHGNAKVTVTWADTMDAPWYGSAENGIRRARWALDNGALKVEVERVGP